MKTAEEVAREIWRDGVDVFDIAEHVESFAREAMIHALNWALPTHPETMPEPLARRIIAGITRLEDGGTLDENG